MAASTKIFTAVTTLLVLSLPCSLTKGNNGNTGTPDENTAPLPQCTETDFQFVYTECDDEQNRWRVAVPNKDCQGGNVPAPIRAPKCGKTCDPGQYLDIDGSQECLPCKKGEFSLGGGELFDTWKELPPGFVVDVELDSWWNEDDTNCSSSLWKPVGPFIQSPGDYCYSKLIYSADLKKEGFVNFTYSLATRDTLFHVQVRNEQCEAVSVGEGRGDKFPGTTGENMWASVTIPLEAGHNIITWKAFGLSSYEESKPPPIYIKEISIMGLDYTSKCTPCPSGTYAPNEGSSECIRCDADSVPNAEATECVSCQRHEYAYPGSSQCTERLPCKDSDYYRIYDYSKCYESDKTKVSYEWIEPIICQYGVAGAVNLPQSGKETCPSCNPGMQLSKESGHCEFCEEGKFSDGKGACEECPALTVPKKVMKYLTWKELPPFMNTLCLSNDDSDPNCQADSGWVPAGDHIHSGENYAEDVYLILSLKVKEFQVSGGYVEGQASPVSTVTFAFKLECHADCNLYFVEEVETAEPEIIKIWTGQTDDVVVYKHSIRTTTPRVFTWAYEKKDPEKELEENVDLRHDVARIYNITVSNVKNGGASYCEPCQQSKNKECISCHEGMYYSNDTQTCTPCPLNTYLSPAEDACIPCGPGLKNVQKRICYSDCKFTLDGTDYDLTPLKGFHTLDTSASFTELGNRFFKRFNISLCGTEEKMETICKADRMSNNVMEKTAEVKSLICRSTILPSGNQQISTQVMSIGDVLLGITHEDTLNNLKDNFTKPRSDDLDVKDIKFFYHSPHTTSACPEGRSTIITLRCNPDAKANGTMEFVPECRDGTCDGCNFLILWNTEMACPSCTEKDYTSIEGSCDQEEQEVTYIWKENKICVGGVSLPPKKTQACEMPKWYNQMPWYAQWSIAGMVTMAILMAVLIIFFWKRNIKLEYKYQKLVASANGELPAAETCALSEGEDEDDVVFQDGKKKSFLNKFKFKNGSGEKGGLLTEEDESFSSHIMEPIPLTNI